jgi:hypothetical protein
MSPDTCKKFVHQVLGHLYSKDRIWFPSRYFELRGLALLDHHYIPLFTPTENFHGKRMSQAGLERKRRSNTLILNFLGDQQHVSGGAGGRGRSNARAQGSARRIE